MNDGDHLSNRVSLDFRLLGLSFGVGVNSRMISSLDRFGGSIPDILTAYLEEKAKGVRNRGSLRRALLESAQLQASESIEAGNLATPVAAELTDSRIRSIENKLHVLDRAIDELAENPGSGEPEPQDEAAEINPDWLNYFEGHAEKATTEHVRGLWGKVLAGEIRKPESFSFTTMRILSEIDQRTATWFAEEVRFRIRGEYILFPQKYEGEVVKRMMALEQIGLLYRVDPGSGLRRTFSPDERGLVLIEEGNMCLLIHTDKKISIKVIDLTVAGRQIATILPPVEPMPMFEKVVEVMKNQASSIEVCEILEDLGDNVRLSDPIRTFF